MTTDRPDDRADEQIEAACNEAVKVIVRVEVEHQGSSPCADKVAYALRDAGLLATPADQDNAIWALADRANFYQRAWESMRGRLGHEMDLRKRAEAEVERLRAERDDYVGRYETAHASRMHAEDCYRRAVAERDQLRRWKAEAAPVLIGLQDLGKALGVPLGTRITGQTAAEQAAALVAERDLLRAQVAAVRVKINVLAEAVEAQCFLDSMVCEEHGVEIYDGECSLVHDIRALDTAGGEQHGE
jgi:hypothetical protein